MTEQQRLYSDSDENVRPIGLTEETARHFYSKYLNFIQKRVGKRDGHLLDVGCGSGWSSYFFASLGYNTVGVDLNPASFEVPELPNLRLQNGDAQQLPFDDGTFDVVASYQTLEHVPDPQVGLEEMLRVVRPGGLVCVVGPNLLSPLASLTGLMWHVWRNRPVKSIFLRTEDMPRHPWGNTLPEGLVVLVKNLALLGRKILSPSVQFHMRAPDMRPPFHADNDACYLCNPLDLVRFFRSKGCEVVKNGCDGRPPLSWLVATKTYVAARRAR
jgi:SAM-dependent methyltransferase